MTRQVVAVLLVLTAVVLGGLRIAGFLSPAFQAIAHLYVGFLFGGYAGTVSERSPDYGLLGLALALSAVEAACFLLGVGR